ncbi:MAG: hypothetical protein KatS3mg102_1958 [Planctomycetota bacterium]|nr:MAG: hypothetical protein KatS3mg102_1958 [Planctomycetota bacterium]
MAARAATVLRVLACRAPRDPSLAAWGRRLPALVHERLRQVQGLCCRLDLEGTPRGRPGEWLLAGRVAVVPERPSPAQTPRVLWQWWLVEAGAPAPVLERRLRFPPEALFASVERVAELTAQALGHAAPRPPACYPATGSFFALRDWLRAVDLDDGHTELEEEDRRRALEWLLLAVEADPGFGPARDALLISALRAHAQGLRREARRAVRLGSLLAPLDARLPYVLAELLALDARLEDAARAYRRCVSVDPEHHEARRKLERLQRRVGGGARDWP